MVPLNTPSPTALSTGRLSPVITDWSTEVSPVSMTPSTGMVSPGSTRTVLPTLICSTGTVLSFPFSITLPVSGARAIRFLSPFFARSVVMSSSNAPICIMNATSPAANRSPISMAAIMAMQISSAEEIFAMPRLWMTRQMDRYSSGMPQITTHTQASFSPAGYPARGNMNEASRNSPPTMVMGQPARKTLILLNIWASG